MDLKESSKKYDLLAKKKMQAVRKGRAEEDMRKVDVKIRFFNFIEKTSSCWHWKGFKEDGYGKIQVGRKSLRAHRVSWQIHNGPIPDKLFVCHSCDVRDCVNPEHLWLGTNSDNIQDAFNKGRKTNKGEHNPNARLTLKDVEKIRQMVASGISQNQTARMLKLWPSTVNDIILGKKWAL